ncbi:unnamed protein product [Paramecium octaurelia]|uniref:Uncharacterized protein n=1 Tax=Paramecium octaurelia TaxID=43137 RepID=A0A8S1XRV9_PAROT|nr:unnamed protein product [Paramecium octaurelia]
MKNTFLSSVINIVLKVKCLAICAKIHIVIYDANKKNYFYFGLDNYDKIVCPYRKNGLIKKQKKLNKIHQQCQNLLGQKLSTVQQIRDFWIQKNLMAIKGCMRGQFNNQWRGYRQFNGPLSNYGSNFQPQPHYYRGKKFREYPKGFDLLVKEEGIIKLKDDQIYRQVQVSQKLSQGKPSNKNDLIVSLNHHNTIKHTPRITSWNFGSIKQGTSQVAKKTNRILFVYRRHDKNLFKTLLHTPLLIKKGSLNTKEELLQEYTHVLSSLTSRTRLYLEILIMVQYSSINLTSIMEQSDLTFTRTIQEKQCNLFRFHFLLRTSIQ